MKIKKFTKNEDGSSEIVFVLNTEQQALLLNYAIESLMARGFVSTVDLSPEDFQKYNDDLQSKVAENFLNSIPSEDMPQA